jgi:hypothetical protein
MQMRRGSYATGMAQLPQLSPIVLRQPGRLKGHDNEEDLSQASGGRRDLLNQVAAGVPVKLPCGFTEDN